MTPTAEQQAILDSLQSSEGNIKVLALAGTGKTSTLLQMVLDNPNTNFLYLSFNKAIEIEVSQKSKKLGINNLRVRTQNSFALDQAKGAGLRKDCNIINGLKAADIRKTLRIEWDKKKKYLAYPAYQVMTKFATSKDERISMRHVSKEIFDTQFNQCRRKFNMSDDAARREADKRVRTIIQLAQELFDTFSFNSFSMPHDIYVKLVQLRMKQINIAEDVVLLDEAQDINPVFADIFEKVNARKIAVGDSNQAIYQFRGAQDYLTEMNADSTFTLTQSFRFLPEIADKANELLEHMCDLRLKGWEKVEEDDSSAVLCRTNMSCLLEAFTIVESNEGLEEESKQKFHLDGGADVEMMQRIEDVVNLHNGDLDKISWSSEISGLKTFTEFKDELEDDLLNIEWKQAERVIDQMGGFENAVANLSRIKAESKDVPGAKVITTMHKSKGKEWNSVRISNDAELIFYSSSIDELGRKSRVAIEFKDAPVMEKNLFYVAVTRAKRNLDLGLCKRLFKKEEVANNEIEVTETETVAA